MVEVQGAQGCLHLAHHAERYGEDPRRWWQEFARANNVGNAGGVYRGMTTLAESYKLFGEFDQFNLGASAGIKKMPRRVLGVVDSCSAGSGAPS